MTSARRLLLILCIALALGAYLATPVNDPDLGWHITVGRWITAHLAVPSIDQWTLIGTGKPWIAYSWLVEVCFHLIHSNFGETGLLAATVLLMTAIAFCLISVYRAVSGSLFFGLFFGMIVSCSLVNHFSLRPQSFVWAYFALCLQAAQALSRKYTLTLLALCSVFALWANTHISAGIGLFAVLSIFLHTHLSARTLTRRQIVIAFSLIATATLVTPYHGREWLVAFDTASHPAIFSSIKEFAPANIFQFSTAFLLLEVVFLATLSLQSGVKPRFIPLFCFAALILSGLMVVKFMPFALIFGGYMLSDLVAASSDQNSGKLLHGLKQLEILIARIPLPLGVFVCICIFTYNSLLLSKDQSRRSFFPNQSVTFILQKKLPLPLLNSFNDGGYLMYRLVQGDGTLLSPVTVDGRTNLYSAQDWKIHSDAFFGRAGWRALIDKTSAQTILWPLESPFTTLLYEDPAWCQIFTEKTEAGSYAVYVAKEAFLKRTDLSAPDCTR